jgi:hypothetical protein
MDVEYKIRYTKEEINNLIKVLPEKLAKKLTEKEKGIDLVENGFLLEVKTSMELNPTVLTVLSKTVELIVLIMSPEMLEGFKQSNTLTSTTINGKLIE